jgi:hypothetical protein
MGTNCVPLLADLFLYSYEADFIEGTISGISYQLRDIYSIYRCCWNVATYEWKVHNGNIEIISFVGDRELLLTRMLLNQGFLLVKLKSSLRKFYGRHHDLVDRYGISVSQMTTDMLTINKTYIYKTKDRVTRTPLKTGGELRCSGRVSSSCSTSDTRLVNIVTNPVISHERGQDWELLTTSGTYHGLWLPLWYLQTLLNHFENTLVQTKFGFIVCHGFDNVNIYVIVYFHVNRILVSPVFDVLTHKY